MNRFPGNLPSSNLSSNEDHHQTPIPSAQEPLNYYENEFYARNPRYRPFRGRIPARFANPLSTDNGQFSSNKNHCQQLPPQERYIRDDLPFVREKCLKASPKTLIPNPTETNVQNYSSPNLNHPTVDETEMNIYSPTNLMKSQFSPTYNSDIGYNRSDDFAHLPDRYEHMQTEYVKFENELIVSKSHSNMNEITSSQVYSNNVKHSKPTSILAESGTQKVMFDKYNSNMFFPHGDSVPKIRSKVDSKTKNLFEIYEQIRVIRAEQKKIGELLNVSAIQSNSIESSPDILPNSSLFNQSNEKFESIASDIVSSLKNGTPETQNICKTTDKSDFYSSNPNTNLNIIEDELKKNILVTSEPVPLIPGLEVHDIFKTHLSGKKKIKNLKDNFISKEKADKIVTDCYSESHDKKNEVFKLNIRGPKSPPEPSARNPNSPVDRLIEPTIRKLKSSAEEKNIKKLLETSKNCSLSRSINSPSEWSKSDSIPFLSGSFDESVPSPIDVNSTDISPQPLSQRCASAISSQKTSYRGKQEPESVLEHAIATLESNEPISAVVGLDYIIEYKNDLRMGGKFPFRCTLCISQIPKASILDHIFGLSHRLRYLRTKDDFTYDQIRQADQDNDKDELINEAVEKLEQECGRGHVIVSLDSSLKGGVRKSSFGNIYKAHLEHESIEFECSRKTIKNTTADAKNRDNIFTETSASKLQKNTIVNFESSSQSNLDSKKNSNNTFTNLFEQVKYHENSYQNKGLFGAPSDPKQNISHAEIEKHNYVGSLLSEKSYKNSNENTSVKRLLSDTVLDKSVKKQYLEVECIDISEDSIPNEDIVPVQIISKATQTDEADVFIPSLLDQLSDFKIQSEMEADVCFQAVDVLLKLLLNNEIKDTNPMNYENALIFQHKSEELHKILDILSDLAAEKGLSSTFHCTKENLSTSSIPLKDKSKYFPSNVELDSVARKTCAKNSKRDTCNPNINVLDNSGNFPIHHAITEGGIRVQKLSENKSSVPSIPNRDSDIRRTVHSDPRLRTTAMNMSVSSASPMRQPPPLSLPISRAFNKIRGGVMWDPSYESDLADLPQRGYNAPPVYQPCSPIYRPLSIPMVSVISIPLVTRPLVIRPQLLDDKNVAPKKTASVTSLRSANSNASTSKLNISCVTRSSSSLDAFNVSTSLLSPSTSTRNAQLSSTAKTNSATLFSPNILKEAAAPALSISISNTVQEAALPQSSAKLISALSLTPNTSSVVLAPPASFSISSANSKSSLPLNISSSTQISSSISAPLLSPSISKPILVPLPPPPLPPSLLSQIPPPPLPISIPNSALISPPFPISPLLPGVSNQIQEFQPPLLPLNVSNPMFASSLIGESPDSQPLSPNNSSPVPPPPLPPNSSVPSPPPPEPSEPFSPSTGKY
ncbi:hypothetical protein CDAR_306391 [Caerostris darwini]|uniref:Uncharacterized protein n=1 Tax=Caerostris darwini TaxID=1538125 RepID=A0AAV4SSQ5_9ARAC|nr:hypothetical protein CDAR_306391 [Caerostris darwini]